MRDQFNQWRGKAKTGSMHVGRWIRRHTVLAAVALLLTVLISPRKVQGQLPSPCCAILAAGLGTINSTLGSVIGGGLQAINTVLSDISNFEQTVIPESGVKKGIGCEFRADLAGLPLQIFMVTLTSLLVRLRSGCVDRLEVWKSPLATGV